MGQTQNNQYVSTASSIDYMENQKYRLEQEIELHSTPF